LKPIIAYNLRRYLMTVFTCCFLLSIKGQSSFRITTAQGLQTNSITDITRDRNNNMWIGSYNGLYKHEGASIRPFVNIGKGAADISGLEMHTVHEDRFGFIWVGTTNGLDKINPSTYEVKHYPIRSKDSSSSFVGYIYAVFQDDEDYMWICTDAAMFRMHYKTGEYVAILVAQNYTGMPSYLVGYNSGIKTGKGIWMDTYDGMVYYEYASKKFYHRYYNPGKKAVFNIITPNPKQRNQSDMEVDSKGNIWYVAAAGLLARYNWQTNQLDTFRFQHPENAWYCCYSVKADARGNIWIGFRHGGLLQFDIKAKKFTPILYKERNSLISSNYVYSLERDYIGNIWVATDNGIDVIDYYNQAVQQRQLSVQPDFTNLQYQASDFSFDGDETLYIPFYKFGFLKYTINTDAVESFGVGNDQKSKGTTYVIPASKSFVWAARDKKLFKVNLLTKKSTEEDYSKVLPKEIEKYPGSVIWYWKQNGTDYVRKNNGLFLQISKDTTIQLKGYGFKKNTTLSLDKKNIWYLTEELNLVKKSIDDNKSDTIGLQEKLKQLDFSFSNPRDMTDDGESIWMTGQNGLLRYNYKTNTLKAYTIKDGLSHTSTYSLIIDDAQRLWAGSIGGIDVFDKSKDFFTSAIRYPASTYQDAFGSALKISEGRLAFHAGNKLFIIKPNDFFTQKQSSYILQFQEMQVNGNSVNIHKDSLLSRLKYFQNRLLFRFGVLQFDQQYHIQYWYKLHQDDDWILHGKNTELTLNELQPGKYQLHIKATDASNHIIAEEKKLSFTILPPFWKTWWFLLLVLLTVVYVLFTFYSKRIKDIKNKAAIQQQLTELESKALRAQMNPHFIFNSLNAIQELIVTENMEEGYRYLSSFSKLLRMVLNYSERNLIPLSNEIEVLQLYLSLEALRFRQSFIYTITVDEKIEVDITQLPSLLLQPYVENAVWHGLRHKEGEKKLSIFIQEKGEQLEIIIEDNGVGREKSEAIKSAKLGAEKMESKGTLLATQRIAILNQQYAGMATTKTLDLKDAMGNATGTRVIIILPILQQSK
jgi:ligand-binding sensor domain-containing protein/anti-sigma regulatory factor (Ser/Thr protein kinase)